MRRTRRPQNGDRQLSADATAAPLSNVELGLVLSGGGSRAAYQVGALKALQHHIERDGVPISIITGSSIGSVNGLTLAACLKNGLSAAIEELEAIWLKRTFRNTFDGSPSGTFFRAIKMAIEKYMAGAEPSPTDDAIFDPTPLMRRIDTVIEKHGGLSPETRAPSLHSIGVMTTMEGSERKPLLFLSTSKGIPEDAMQGASFEVYEHNLLTAKHAFASAALPSVLPPVEIHVQDSKVRLVDGGISINVPVDPAVRLGANRVILVDVSGRDWWCDRYGKAHDSRPDWEVAAGSETYCAMPPETFIVRCQKPLGPLLKKATGSSTSTFIQSVGPTWPLFKLLKSKLGEDVAYEAMSYVALHPEYSRALIERGYNETLAVLRRRDKRMFRSSGQTIAAEESAA